MDMETVSPHGMLVAPGAVGSIGNLLQQLSINRILIIGGSKALELVGDAINDSVLAEAPQCQVICEVFKGECSHLNVRKLELVAREQLVEGIVAVGGGKAIDAAKLVAQNCGIPVITVPTSAATCAAWTALSVMYTEEGAYESYSKLHLCPNRIIIDLELLLTSPVRLLAAGIGDAIVKWYELEIAIRAGVSLNAMTKVALSIAATCKEILFEESAIAFAQAKEGQIDSEFKSIIEACIKMPGMVSGVTTGSHLSVAHAFNNALTLNPACRKNLHGEAVFFGLLVQCIIFKTDDEDIRRLVALGKTLHLPLSLASLGIEDSDTEALSNIAAHLLESVRFENIIGSVGEVTNKRIVEAIQSTSRSGRIAEQEAGY